MKPISNPHLLQRQTSRYIGARMGTQGHYRVLGWVLKDHPIQPSDFSNREMKALTKGSEWDRIASRTQVSQTLSTRPQCVPSAWTALNNEGGAARPGIFLWSRRKWALHWYLQVSVKLSQWRAQWPEWGDTQGCFLEAGADLLICMPFLLPYPFN